MTFMDEDQKEYRASLWHTAAHVLGHAVLQLYPDAKRTIGPAIESGFYYDFFREKPFTPEDLEKIEQRMKEIAAQDHKLFREDKTVAEAKELSKDNPFKLELIDEFAPSGEGTLSFYCHADYKDLCKGGHVESTGLIKAIKLLKTSGAYWRGNANNPQLQRIYGIAFPSEKELQDYLKQLEEAEKRNHVKIGKQMDLFSSHIEGPGFPFWHFNGMILKNELTRYWREVHYREGYLEIQTPILLNRSLWERSGHWTLYKDNMYTTVIDGQDYAIKPMNCPGGMLVYKTTMHSYRELPLRIAELGLVHRHEISGVLNGVLRVRAFTQDDAHIFVTEEQLQDEIKRIVGIFREMLGTIGFNEYEYTLSVRSEEKKDKYLGSDEGWNAAEKAIKQALNSLGLKFSIEEGEAKFYGPSLDVQIKDALGRKWQCSTIQMDFNLPERFDITYEGQDGQKHKPFVLHRVVYGSLERFIGVLTEHYVGQFPLWLSPVQAKVLSLTDRHAEYGNKLAKQMREAGLRVESDDRSLTVSKKVREAQLEKIPLVMVIGDKEIETKMLNVRTLDGKTYEGIPMEDLLKKLKENIENRKPKIDF